MAYLRTKSKGGRDRYDIVESRRENGKVKQTILEYIGTEENQKNASGAQQKRKPGILCLQRSLASCMLWTSKLMLGTGNRKFTHVWCMKSTDKRMMFITKKRRRRRKLLEFTGASGTSDMGEDWEMRFAWYEDAWNDDVRWQELG